MHFFHLNYLTVTIFVAIVHSLLEEIYEILVGK